MIEFPEDMNYSLIALLAIGAVMILAVIILLTINYFQEVKRVEKQREKEKEKYAKKNGKDKVGRTK